LLVLFITLFTRRFQPVQQAFIFAINIGQEVQGVVFTSKWECAERLRDAAPSFQRKLQLSHSIAHRHTQLSIRLDIQSAIGIQSVLMLE